MRHGQEVKLNYKAALNLMNVRTAKRMKNKPEHLEADISTCLQPISGICVMFTVVPRPRRAVHRIQARLVGLPLVVVSQKMNSRILRNDHYKTTSGIPPSLLWVRLPLCSVTLHLLKLLLTHLRPKFPHPKIDSPMQASYPWAMSLFPL